MVRDPDAGLTEPAGKAPRAGMLDRVAARARQGWAWLQRPLPTPPAAVRRGPLRAKAFDSPLRSPRLTSQLGIALAVAFTMCFVTGLISHFIAHPAAWFWWPSRPVGLYRVTQGLHVATGLASIPLLGAKLWAVYPRLFAWPPARTIVHAVERASVAVLVAAALFQLVSGVFNISRWYRPMPFFFTAGHYWSAWLAIGALLIHIGVKLPIIRAAFTNPPRDRTGADAVTRRTLLTTIAAAAGLITVTTVGQTVTPLSRISVLAPRRPGYGPQNLPVNQTAAGAAVRELALDPAYRLVVVGPERQVSLSLADLNGLAQHTVILPISCVEGWSSSGTWTGVRLRDLIAMVGVDPDDAEAYVESLQARGRYRSTTVPPSHTRDPFTLIALRLQGTPLHPDHGYPARLIAPNRPGVLQTKWVGRITARSPR